MKELLLSILGRQSVSNDKYEIFAYDILYRSDSTNIDSTDISASACSIAAVLNDFGGCAMRTYARILLPPLDEINIA